MTSSLASSGPGDNGPGIGALVGGKAAGGTLLTDYDILRDVRRGWEMQGQPYHGAGLLNAYIVPETRTYVETFPTAARSPSGLISVWSSATALTLKGNLDCHRDCSPGDRAYPYPKRKNWDKVSGSAHECSKYLGTVAELIQKVQVDGLGLQTDFFLFPFALFWDRERGVSTVSNVLVMVFNRVAGLSATGWKRSERNQWAT